MTGARRDTSKNNHKRKHAFKAKAGEALKFSAEIKPSFHESVYKQLGPTVCAKVLQTKEQSIRAPNFR